MKLRSGSLNCKGFTLIEALLGFLILSVGMLGIASLQAISLKSGKTSVYNSVAVMKVDELLESIRINPSVIALTEYAAKGDGVGAPHNCTTAACSAVQLAEEDIFWWKQNLTAGLPATADTKTEVTMVPPNPILPSKMAQVTVTINWKERNLDKDLAGASASVDKSYSTTANICTMDPC